MNNIPKLIDPFNRAITYLRVSVTDRCDFRCVYCMSENMNFLPKADLLTLEELDKMCTAFISQGVEKLRITGGEPLVRRNIMEFFNSISRHLKTGALKELTLTTNGSQLHRFAEQLAEIGIKRINVSLDTLNEEKFSQITRWGRLVQVLKGIDAALAAGIKIKINTVALKDFNEDGQTIVMVTHDIKSESYANRVVFLKDGRIEGELDLKKYQTDNQEKVIFDFLSEKGW